MIRTKWRLASVLAAAVATLVLLNGLYEAQWLERCEVFDEPCHSEELEARGWPVGWFVVEQSPALNLSGWQRVLWSRALLYFAAFFLCSFPPAVLVAIALQTLWNLDSTPA